LICGFVFRLNPSGNALVYSTYVSACEGIAVAVDAAKSAYVTGSVNELGGPSSVFQTTPGAYKTIATAIDGFVEKYAADGSVQYATLLGLNPGGANAIIVDAQGFAYVAGTTGTLSAFQGVAGARSVTSTTGVFVAQLGTAGTTLPWAAILGGSGSDTPHAIARDTSGVLYVAGETTSTDLPVTAGVIQTVAHGHSDGFVASVSADGSAFGFVTYLGGSADDQIYAMALTSGGQIVVAGDTLSPDFPVTGAIQPLLGGNRASLYATTNSGGNWTAEGIGLPSSVNVLSVDPTNSAIVVAATGEGLFRTTNGGVSWSEVDTPGGGFFGGPPPGSNYTGLSRSLANSAVLYALRSDSSVSISSDSGATWTVPGLFESEGAYAMVYIVASPTEQNEFLGITWEGGVCGGNASCSLPPIATLSFPPTASPDGSIYIGMISASGLWGIGRSTDNGATWNFLPGSPSGQSIYGPPISVCTVNPAVLYAGDYYYFDRSSDTGLTWTTLSLVTFPLEFSVAPSNCQVVYVIASPFGLELSTDSGGTWSSATGDLTASTFNALAVDPTNPAHAWVVANVYADGFVAKISNDGKTLLWSTFYGGSNTEDVHGVVVDGSGNAWIGGSTLSIDLPLTTGLPQATGPYQSVLMLAEISDATAACSYYLTPGSALSYGAGIINFALTAPSGCAWTATPTSTWITTVNPSAGTASAPIAAVVSANNTTATRTGTITLGNQSFTITQVSSGCQYSVDNSSFVLPARGGQVTVNLTAGPGCPWSVVPGSLAVVSGASGTGNGPVTLSAPANSGMDAVSYTANVGPTPVKVTVAEDCTYSLSPLTFDGSLTNFIVALTPSNAACIWSVSTTSAWLTVSGSSGTGSENISLDAASTNRTGAPRTANITVGSQTFTLVQNVDTLPQYTLTVLVQPPGAGTAGPNVTADAGSSPCMYATANSGWVFANWSGAGLAYPASSYTTACITLNNDVTATANFVSTSALYFVPMTPCRVADTRYANGAFGSPSLAAGSTRSFVIPNGTNCGVPTTAAAYSLNVTVVPQGTLDYLTVWPGGATQPVVSTLNSVDGRIKANAAIIPAGAGGAVSVYATNTTDLILDIDGYFLPFGSNSSALAFYPLTPCRIADTRYSSFGSLGPPSLTAGQSRSFNVLSSACNVPSTAQAYSLNLTVVPPGTSRVNYITTYPTGATMPLASTLNDMTGTIVANAAIVPAGTSGAVSVYSYSATDLIIDINGYFAPPGAGGLSLYNLTPCRVLDSRLPSGTPPFTGEKDANVTGSACAAPVTAQAYVFNATVVPPGPMNYLTLWAQGGTQPVVSTLNALDGAITSNMALVPTTNGSISSYVYVPSTAYLILDLFGYFAP
jgi:hypothetical protein